MDKSNKYISTYYDDFSKHLLNDYLQGNLRLAAQYKFFEDSVPTGSATILVVGCGSGESAQMLARRSRQTGRILAVDISPENINLARRLFPHPKVQYQVMDVTSSQLKERFDCVILPDVYEHIPREHREGLIRSLAAILEPEGTVVATIPSPTHQEELMRRGTGLQVVDEIVTLEDILKFSEVLGGHLRYFNLVSVFKTGDYIHFIIGKGSATERVIQTRDRKPIHRAEVSAEQSLLRLKGRILSRLRRWIRTRHVERTLGKGTAQTANNKL